MKKNNFSIMMLVGVVVLSGISFDVHGSENNKAIALGAAGLAAAGLAAYVTNTQTYQDW